MATDSLDIFVANDNAPNLLFHNLGGKKFEEVALEAGVAYPRSGSAISGMGADFRDINNDGRPDIWHTAIENEIVPAVHESWAAADFWRSTASSRLGDARGDVRLVERHFRFRQ